MELYAFPEGCYFSLVKVSPALAEILARKKAGIEDLYTRRQRQGERLAQWVEQTPDAIERGLSVLQRRLTRQNCHARELSIQWVNILTSQPREEIVKLLRSPSEEDDPLRACAPFIPSESQE